MKQSINHTGFLPFLIVGMIVPIQIVHSAGVQRYEEGNTVFYELFPEGLKPTGMDNKIYQSLKKNPLQCSMNVLLMSWSNLINHKKLPLVRKGVLLLKGNTLTVCTHEHYARVLPLLESMGVTHLFVTQARKGQRWHKIKILPLPYQPSCTAPPAEHKDILYSFVGFKSHPLRDKIFNLPFRSLPDVVIKRRNSWYFSDKKGLEARVAEYKDILARSRFGLCPRGNSPNTIRMVELMGAGAIPVVLADDLYLPPGVDWTKCIIRIKETHVRNVDRVIRAISPEKEAHMRSECLRVYQLLIDDPAYFVRSTLQ